MTIQQAKQELRSYRKEAEELKCRKEDVRILESRLYSGGGGNLEDGVIALVELKECYREAVEQMARRRLRAEQKIISLPQPYRSVLYLYYLKGYSQIRIAAQLHYSDTYISKLIRRALLMYVDEPVSAEEKCCG